MQALSVDRSGAGADYYIPGSAVPDGVYQGLGHGLRAICPAPVCPPCGFVAFWSCPVVANPGILGGQVAIDQIVKTEFRMLVRVGNENRVLRVCG